MEITLATGWSVIDANGSKLWDDKLLRNNSSSNRDVILTNDGNFILLGVMLMQVVTLISTSYGLSEN